MKMKVLKKYKLFFPYPWEVIFFGLSICMIIFSKPFEKDHNYLLSLFVGTGTCILTAVLIFYVQRCIRANKLWNYYSKIEDTYIRIDIGQDNSNVIENNYIKLNNVNLEISLLYNGENKFRAEIQYWKHDNAKAIGNFEFNETNKMRGSGIYKYIAGDIYLNHFGSYEIYLLEDEPDKIYLRYQHVFPREMDNSPDNNRGWEIWKRKTVVNKSIR